MRWRRLAVSASVIAIASLALALWALSQLRESPTAIAVQSTLPSALAPAAPPEDRLAVSPASFADLPGWESDRLSQALPALTGSCISAAREGSGGDLGAILTHSASALRDVCAALAALPAGDDATARHFLEKNFSPWQITNHGEREGLFTGYYEPELSGSRTKRKPFVHPLYLTPRDQQIVDLGEFKTDLAGRKITGLVRGGRFRPYWDRAEIEGGALSGKGLEMLWVDDPVALFFLQIQGSGRVVLPDGKIVRIGYSGQNGRDYTAIGKVLIARGELTREEVSLQTIRAWLRAHPDGADEVMRTNRSYVFFRVLPGAPVGAAGVELTPGRSLAVDSRFLPFGLPLWLDATLPPLPELGRAESVPLQRLVVPQDRGGAIKGPVRGDVFWGAGREAEAIAGRMKQPGRLWLLWPKVLPPPNTPVPAPVDEAAAPPVPAARP
ncbi:MAG: murein transglycosylase A [Thermoanaerobaculia bacterium]